MKGICTGLLVASLLCLPAAMRGQMDTTAPVSNAMPSNNFGFNLPTHLGTLTYALSGSELLQTGYGNGSVYASTDLSGDLAYLSKSEFDPFSLIYTGGLVFSGLPGTSSVETFQNVAASQVYRTKSWVFLASDAFSYLPGAPTAGLSGVAGVGDVGVFPVQSGIGPAQNILTGSTSITNGLQGSASWQTTASLNLEASGQWQVLHYTGNNSGLDMNQTGATFGPNYRIDARNSVGAQAYYNQSGYPGYANYKIETEGVYIDFNRAWTRRVSTTINFGPARTHGATFAPIPKQWNMAGSASVTYATRSTGFYGSYSRSVNGGSGIIFGAMSDTVTAGMDRPINRDWSSGLQVSYSHNVGLVPVGNLSPVYNATFGSAQVSRRLGETLSMYASYTAVSQSAKNQPVYSSNAFNGLNHTISVGITFAPAPLLSGR